MKRTFVLTAIVVFVLAGASGASAQLIAAKEGPIDRSASSLRFSGCVRGGFGLRVSAGHQLVPR